MMKKRSLICLLIILALTFTACGKKDQPVTTPEVEAGAGETETAVEEAPAEGSWLEQAKLDEAGTTEELYEAAKEEGKVVVYSMTSRISDIAEAFEEEYPGVKVEYYDMRMAEIFEKFEREYEAGIKNVDVLFVKDSDGVAYNEFFKPGLLHAYIPSDLTETVSDEFKEFAFAPYFEIKQIFYNTEVYPDGPDITSWWDLTKPEYKGKLMFANPITSAEMMGLFMVMIEHADEMEADYKDVFGEEIVLNGTKNAGYEFVKRLVENDPVLTTSDSDIAKAIGASGQENPPFGIVISSKLRQRETKGLLIGAIEDLTPRDSVMAPAIIGVADGSEHVNAAKLLIRYIGGETEGDGPGFAPFHVQGGWPTRADVAPEDTPTLDTLNLWPLDLDYNYDNVEDTRDFWLSLQ